MYSIGMNSLIKYKNEFSPYLDVQAYPVLLPYVTCIKQKLFLGLRFVEKTTKKQSQFLQNCNGNQNFLQILQLYSIDVTEIIHLTKYLLWWPSPVNEYLNSFKNSDRLVLSASTELAWLGMGGVLMNGAAEKKTTLLTCFSAASTGTQSLYFDTVAQQNLSCKDEAFFASRVAGIGHVHWNLNASSISARHEESELHKLNFEIFREMLISFIRDTEPKEIFAPAGLRYEYGAVAIRDTLLQLKAEGYITSKVYFYEDSPSLSGYRAIDEFHSEFETSYLVPIENYVDVSEIAKLKFLIMDVFKSRITSQKKKLWLNSGKKNAEVSGHTEWESAERYWELSFSKSIL